MLSIAAKADGSTPVWALVLCSPLVPLETVILACRVRLWLQVSTASNDRRFNPSNLAPTGTAKQLSARSDVQGFDLD